MNPFFLTAKGVDRNAASRSEKLIEQWLWKKHPHIKLYGYPIQPAVRGRVPDTVSLSRSRSLMSALHLLVRHTSIKLAETGDDCLANLLFVDLGPIDPSSSVTSELGDFEIPPPNIISNYPVPKSDQSLLHLQAPYARITLWHDQEGVNGATVYYHYCYDWFVQECFAMQALAFGGSIHKLFNPSPPPELVELPDEIQTSNILVDEARNLARGLSYPLGTSHRTVSNTHHPVSAEAKCCSIYLDEFIFRNIFYRFVALVTLFGQPSRSKHCSGWPQRETQQWWRHLSSPQEYSLTTAGVKEQIQSEYPLEHIDRSYDFNHPYRLGLACSFNENFSRGVRRMDYYDRINKYMFIVDGTPTSAIDFLKVTDENWARDLRAALLR
ncbi:MAG: hypothetical protein AAFV45_03075 [Pseudomonadota bacterium]